jgi:hypothetical protein
MFYFDNRPPSNADPDTAYIKYDEAKLQEFEFKINNVINLCQARINWLLRGSRRVRTLCIINPPTGSDNEC